MSENQEKVDGVEEDEYYVAPPQKSIEEIMKTDAEDESLRKYKEALLGEAQTETIIIGKSSQITHFLKINTICVFQMPTIQKTLL